MADHPLHHKKEELMRSRMLISLVAVVLLPVAAAGVSRDGAVAQDTATQGHPLDGV